MDLLTSDHLQYFLTDYPGWHLSLYMPTFHSGRETDQNQIRYKNLLQEAEQRLLDKKLRTPEVRDLLKPALQLLDRPGFWRHQSHGLAVFFSQDLFEYYRLPISFESLVQISDRFHLKPLLPLFTSDGHFYILALSQNQVRLLEGTRDSVDEIDLENVPQSIAETLQNKTIDKKLQFHTGAPLTGSGDRAGVFHGHDPSNTEKTRILNWFHRIDDTLPNLLIGKESPLVLAGVNYLFPLYKQANSYRNLVDKGIPGNPEELKPEELHAQAWPLVEPCFHAAQEQAAAKFYQLSGSDKTTTDVEQAVLAAHHARVSDLFVPLKEQVWGNFDPDHHSVQIHQEKQPGDRDLLDLAALETLLNGGEVYAVELEKMPADAPIAAVLRY